MELRHRLGQVQKSEDRRGADADVSSHHSGKFVQIRTSSVELFENPSNPGQEQLAGMGDCDPSSGALEQACSQLGFEPADLSGDRGLGDVQLIGGSGEPAAARYRLEVHKLPKLHRFRMIRDECERKHVLDLSAFDGEP